MRAAASDPTASAGPTDTGSPPGRPDPDPAAGTIPPAADGAAGADDTAAGTGTVAAPADGQAAAGGVHVAAVRDGGTARGVTFPVGTATPPGPGTFGTGAAAANSGTERMHASKASATRNASYHR